MNNDLKFMGYKTILLSSLLAASVVFAQEETKDTASVESRQLSLLEKLTNYEANALGFAINGNAKAGYLHSSISSDALTDDSQLSEASAYTRMNMVFSVRPSSESVAKFDLRFHKDWQNAHREGNNSPITTWWSYDGYFLNLDGRICGEGLAVFAVGGMAAIYLLVPVLDAIASRASIRILAPLCLALLLCFGCDLVYSHISPNMGEGITELPATEMSESFPAPEAGNGAAFAPNPNPETNPKIMKG